MGDIITQTVRSDYGRQISLFIPKFSILIIKKIGNNTVKYGWNNETNNLLKIGGKENTEILSFINDIKACLCYLKRCSNSAKNVIDALSSCNLKTIIRQSDGESHFAQKESTVTIHFCISSMLKLNEDEVNDSYESVALCLFHELYHSYDCLINKMKRNSYEQNQVEPEFMDSFEKNAVIYTNTVAKELGEPVRHDYISARPYSRYNFGNSTPVTFFINNQKENL